MHSQEPQGIGGNLSQCEKQCFCNLVSTISVSVGFPPSGRHYQNIKAAIFECNSYTVQLAESVVTQYARVHCHQKQVLGLKSSSSQTPPTVSRTVFWCRPQCVLLESHQQKEITTSVNKKQLGWCKQCHKNNFQVNYYSGFFGFFVLFKDMGYLGSTYL